ncbi:MAG TPA: 16S rRNA (cytosine(1402)-N(4))-methyltransferase RsmH, partial [Pyrinomonadaceae bacterium]|nr:16S rRNA (cytosine(1402)-N(4))-methyltransferase RsmH [Pyrinomonadaceae bacterium]
EILGFLQPETGLFVDATLGMGGHTEAILNASAETKVIAFDRDREAIEKASERLKDFGERFRAVYADFRQIKQFVEAETTNGVLADLGVSSWQLDSVERGFSFRADALLDMRMNAGSDEPTAADLLETLSEEEIADIIYQYGEERFSRRIARRIVEKRERGEKIETTAQLAETVERAIPRSKQEKIHPATRTFQALRIAVNRELENLDEFIADAIDVLKPDGRLAVISFHSLEDRIVKQTFRRLSGRCECPPRLPVCQCGAVRRIEILTNRPVTAEEKEIESNPRSRSAKLRVCRKLTKEEI